MMSTSLRVAIEPPLQRRSAHGDMATAPGRECDPAVAQREQERDRETAACRVAGNEHAPGIDVTGASSRSRRGAVWS
jgi:hypothetical protein